MKTSSLLERLRKALAPRYKVESELARGGMGQVFLAFDTSLDCRVAIKVLLPQMTTSWAAQRFVREARILAALSHSHIIPVHHAGEADGLSYYVMDYIEGETLKGRLGRGRLTLKETVKLGRDLLDALQAVHEAGVVHRDIKPENIFLLGNRTLLVDFGIAKSSRAGDDSLTASGFQPGTPFYMAPEVAFGHQATPQTDIYSSGMVIYEALTGRAWETGTDPRKGDWLGVPRQIKVILMKALALAPTERWSSAALFRRTLWRTRTRRYLIRGWLTAAAGILVGGIATFLILRLAQQRDTPDEAVTIQLTGFRAGAQVRAELADSIALSFGHLLSGPDYRICAVDNPCTSPDLMLLGTVARRDSLVTLTLESPENPDLFATGTGSLDHWTEVVEEVAFSFVLKLWRRNGPLSEFLPVDVLPRRIAGLRELFRAERLFSQAQFWNARAAYHSAVEIDSTCLLCSWRITEVERWHSIPPDEFHATLALDSVNRFPPYYRVLIEARMLPLAERLDTLLSATELWPRFYLAWYELGRELFHRGPLVQRRRGAAIDALRHAANLRSDFLPTWQRLLWAASAEGNRELADSARMKLEQLQAPGETDPIGRILGVLVNVGYAYRFGDEELVGEVVSGLGDLVNDPRAPAGPRLLPTFDAPDGAIALGTVFSNMPGRFRVSGLAARGFAYISKGQLQRARAQFAELENEFPGQFGFSLFAAQLDAALLMFDPEAVDQTPEQIAAELVQHVNPDVSSAAERRSAAWLLSLLSVAAGLDQHVDAYSRTIRPSDLDDPLARLLEAASYARDGRFEEALALTDTLRLQTTSKVMIRTDSGVRERRGLPDNFFRTVLHLLRAEWQLALGNRQAAAGLLRWYQHSDQGPLPTGAPTPQDVDWSFGTLAAWKLARVQDALPERQGEACTAYAEVARKWREGDPIYAARADSAATRRQDLECP